jgi:hypothetical protein
MKDIHALLAQDPALTPLDTVEDVLTAGYAQALALEARSCAWSAGSGSSHASATPPRTMPPPPTS